jgi:hypothetical protein
LTHLNSWFSVTSIDGVFFLLLLGTPHSHASFLLEIILQLWNLSPRNECVFLGAVSEWKLIFLVVPELELRAPQLLHRCSTTWVMPSDLLSLAVLEIGSCFFTCFFILLSVTGMTDKCHHTQLLVEMGLSSYLPGLA